MRDLVAYMLAQTFEEKVGKFQKDGRALLVVEAPAELEHAKDRNDP